MIEDFRKHAAEKFPNDGNNFKYGRKSDYISYTAFVKYFSDLREIKQHHLIIGINFSYGWMPRCFNFHFDNINESDNLTMAVKILNKTKLGTRPKPEELKFLKGLLNNSLVGTSKLLHFINPNIIAIWDSRVYRYLTGNGPTDKEIGNCEAFLDYLNFCDELTRQDSYHQIHTNIVKITHCEMTKLRTAELIMYSNGAEPK